MQTRAIRRGEFQEPWASTFVGSCFRVWAPRVMNEILRDQEKVEEGNEQMQGGEVKERKEQKMPSDEYEKQREAYYAFIDDKYSRKENSEVHDEEGRLKVWTDGSARNTRKGTRRERGFSIGMGVGRTRDGRCSENKRIKGQNSQQCSGAWKGRKDPY